MGGARSKIKGSNGERELAKILSASLGGSFVRSAHSGALIGGKNVVRKQTLSKGQIISARGDIVPPDHMPHFVIESKSYSDFRFHQLLQPGHCTVLNDWIKQTIDIVDPEDQWFVGFKINLRGWFIAVPEQEANDYEFENYSLYLSPHGKVRITDLRSFITTNRARIIDKTA